LEVIVAGEKFRFSSSYDLEKEINFISQSLKWFDIASLKNLALLGED
jgi:hypothetical protein